MRFYLQHSTVMLLGIVLITCGGVGFDDGGGFSADNYDGPVNLLIVVVGVAILLLGLTSVWRKHEQEHNP